MNKFKIGDKVTIADLADSGTVDKIREDGLIHLKGEFQNVWSHPNILKRVGENGI